MYAVVYPEVCVYLRNRIRPPRAPNPESGESDTICQDSYPIHGIRPYPYRVRQIPIVPCTDMAVSRTAEFAVQKSVIFAL